MISIICKIVAWLSLGVLIIPGLWFLAGYGNLVQVKTLMLVATVAWFLSTAISQKAKSGCYSNER